MVVQTEQNPQTAGEPIRFWRTRRGLSQLLVHLAQHLDLPIAERNRLLLAGGFAPPSRSAPRNRQGAATRSVSVSEYDIADVRPLFGKGRA